MAQTSIGWPFAVEDEPLLEVRDTPCSQQLGRLRQQILEAQTKLQKAENDWNKQRNELRKLRDQYRQVEKGNL